MRAPVQFGQPFALSIHAQANVRMVNDHGQGYVRFSVAGIQAYQNDLLVPGAVLTEIPEPGAIGLGCFGIAFMAASRRFTRRT